MLCGKGWEKGVKLVVWEGGVGGGRGFEVKLVCLCVPVSRSPSILKLCVLELET
jgi:hypothetical protein